MLIDLFAAQVERGPDRVAARYADDVLTYAELDAASSRLAGYLGARYGGRERRETVVGVFVERSLDMLVTLLGVLRAGFAYVPLDPAYPDERLVRMLAGSCARVAVTRESLAGRLAAIAARAGCEGISLDADRETIARFPAHADAAIRPGDLAYVLYTSGSTGSPKGVEIEHRALANFLLSMQRSPGLDAHDRLLAVTTISFDIAALELYLPLICGAQVIIAPAETARDGARLAQALGAGGVTVMQATPSTWRMLLAAEWRGDPQLKVLSGGEALPRALANELLPRCGSLWNLYGPTETTIWSSVHRVDGAGPSESVSIGRPIAETRFAVLDAQLDPVPSGACGELYVGGTGVARGYRGNPALTAQRFVADPSESGRLYRTGDLAAQRPDGSAEFLGRADQQVKIRGFRVELGEIEAALDAQSGVAHSVLVARDPGPNGRQLVAYVVPADATPPDPAVLRAGLRERLPDYMVPSSFVLLDALPLTANGKVDRQALPAPERRRTAHRAPRNDEESILRGLFAELLRLDDFGIDEDFFALGGDSIMTIQIVHRARSAGLALTQRDVFEHPTVAALAAVATRFVNAPPVAPVATATPDTFALTPLQREFVTAPDGYRVQMRVDFAGPLDAGRIQSAAEALVRRHANLRAALFPARGVQVFAPAADVPWRVVDLTALDDAARDARREELCLTDRSEPFVLARAPLLRFMLLRLGAGRHELVFTFEHAILDGWSLPIVFDELFALYSNGGAIEQLPLVRPYAEYLSWLQSRDRAAALGRWRTYLAGLVGPTLVAPTVAAVPDATRTEFVEASLPRELTRALQQLARERGVTLNAIVQGLWAVEVARLTGRDDVVFGVTVAGRPAEVAGVEDMVGLFVNTLPARVRVDRAAPLAGVFAAIQAGQPRLLADQYVSLSDIDGPGGTATFDSLIVFQNYPHRPPVELPDGLRVVGTRGHGEEAHFALNLMVVPSERMRLRLDYDATRLDRPGVEAIAANLVRLSEIAVARPDTPLGSLSDAPPRSSQESPEMTNPFDDDDGEFMVLVNDEEQYSLWPAFREIAPGWTAVGPKGSRRECLDWIDATWTDMRPKGLRESMDVAARHR